MSTFREYFTKYFINIDKENNLSVMAFYELTLPFIKIGNSIVEVLFLFLVEIFFVKSLDISEFWNQKPRPVLHVAKQVVVWKRADLENTPWRNISLHVRGYLLSYI